MNERHSPSRPRRTLDATVALLSSLLYSWPIKDVVNKPRALQFWMTRERAPQAVDARTAAAGYSGTRGGGSRAAGSTH